MQKNNQKARNKKEELIDLMWAHGDTEDQIAYTIGIDVTEVCGYLDRGDRNDR